MSNRESSSGNIELISKFFYFFHVLTFLTIIFMYDSCFEGVG